MNASDYTGRQDEELERLAGGGDKDAFSELYSRHFDRVYDFSLRLLRDADEAADAAQETFLKAMAALSPKEKHAAFTTWILTIARNLCLNRLRSRRGRPSASLEETESEAIYQQVDTDRLASPEEALEAKELAGLVWQAAAALDPRQYSLLDLHLRQGLDSGEIATMLGKSKNSAYVMLSRLKDSVEESITAFIMARRGPQNCVNLSRLLERRRASSFDADTRKLVTRHIEACSTCQEQRKKLVSPTAILGAFAAAPVPFGLKQQAMAKALGHWTALAGREAADAGGFLSHLFRPFGTATGGAKQAGWFAGWKAATAGVGAVMIVGGITTGMLIRSGVFDKPNGESASAPEGADVSSAQTPISIPTQEPTETSEPVRVPTEEEIAQVITEGFKGYTPDPQLPRSQSDLNEILEHLSLCNDSMKPFHAPNAPADVPIFDPNVDKQRYLGQVLGQCEYVGGATKGLFLDTQVQGLTAQNGNFLKANWMMRIRHKDLLGELGYMNDWSSDENRYYDISRDYQPSPSQ